MSIDIWTDFGDNNSSVSGRAAVGTYFLSAGRQRQPARVVVPGLQRHVGRLVRVRLGLGPTAGSASTSRATISAERRRAHSSISRCHSGATPRGGTAWASKTDRTPASDCPPPRFRSTKTTNTLSGSVVRRGCLRERLGNVLRQRRRRQPEGHRPVDHLGIGLERHAAFGPRAPARCPRARLQLDVCGVGPTATRDRSATRARRSRHRKNHDDSDNAGDHDDARNAGRNRDAARILDVVHVLPLGPDEADGGE